MTDTRKNIATGLLAVLVAKRRAKFNPTLRVEDLPIAAIGYFLGKASDL